MGEGGGPVERPVSVGSRNTHPAPPPSSWATWSVRPYNPIGAPRVPEKHFEVVLNELGERLRVRFATDRGEVVRYVEGEAIGEGRTV